MLVTPHLDSSDWVIGPCRRPPARNNPARIEQALRQALAHRRKIEAGFAKAGLAFCLDTVSQAKGLITI